MSHDLTGPSRPRWILPGAVVIGLTLLSGLAHGFLDGRWSAAVDLKAIGQELETLPETCGDWKMVENTGLNEDAAELLRCYGSQVRTYYNEKRDATVNVAVLFGPRGPIAVHTPEVCYDSVGTKQVGETQRERVGTSKVPHQFWKARFARAPEPEPSLEVWYAWSDGGPWEARNQPRFWLTDTLYKLQLAGPASHSSNGPCQDFLKAFLPHTEHVLQ